MVTETQMKTEVENNEYWNDFSFLEKGEDVVVNGKAYPTAIVFKVVDNKKEYLSLTRFREGNVYKRNGKKVFDKDNNLVEELSNKKVVKTEVKPKITLVHPTCLF